ncbi:MAG: polysaccharide deacetylase family protein [Candidatus Omnitrophica bacterium]|nr:polysaccharide deacetylase family protein [Candidatus Omnitrophota bacterium]
MPKRKRIIILILVAALALLSGVNFIRTKYVAPIAMYHMINTKDNPYVRALIVNPRTFRRQMHFLKTHRYNVLPLEELVDLIAQKKNIPPKAIAITFDDGYRDNYTNAFPVLKEFGLPATMFIIINEVGRAQGDRLSWGEIKEMQDSGLISFGSHCLGPEPLVNIKSEGVIKREIADSKKILEEKLGLPVNLFSYPEGKFNPRIRQLVIESGYKGAVATSPGKNYPGDDIFALKRLRISRTSDNLFVFWVETSGYYTFLKEHRDHD